MLLTVPMLLLFSFKEGGSTGKKINSVNVKRVHGEFHLYRNGEPYFIKGAGGTMYFDRLKECGGNSIRLWSTVGAKELMDQAYEMGLSVTLGLDLGHERKGFDYSDKKAVKEQLERVKKDILAFKDHPALLIWGIGNEVDQFAKNFKVWDAVQEIAKFIHEIDPHHPTTTMLAGVPVHHIRQIVKRCPDLDILSINAFKWIEPVRNDITAAGWKGPYLIGEWGPSGYWESDTLPWGAFMEETSTQKIEACRNRYTKGILANSDRCLGGYVFYWGWKQARTHTLLSLYTEDGKENGVQDMLYEVWNSSPPRNRAPEILPVGIDEYQVHKGVYLKPGSLHHAYTSAKDADGDSLNYNWEIYEESKEKKEGGDWEPKPAVIPNTVIDGKTRALYFKAPEKPGAYRMFVYAYDGHNHVATANAPFYVR